MVLSFLSNLLLCRDHPSLASGLGEKQGPPRWVASRLGEESQGTVVKGSDVIFNAYQNLLCFSQSQCWRMWLPDAADGNSESDQRHLQVQLVQYQFTCCHHPIQLVDKFAPLTVCAQDDSPTDVDFPDTGHTEMKDKTQVHSVNWK